jgi:predicted RNA-binding Zn-ribbon protein involved in translation (DUF1610 family)
MEKEKNFIVCPNCGSTGIRWLSGGNLGDQYRCAHCGYQGIALKGSVRFIKELQGKGK